MKNLKQKTYAYALKNALAHGGKANQGPIISSLFNEGLKKNEVKKYIKEISNIIKEVNSLSLEKQKKEFEKLEDKVSKREVRVGLREFPNVKKSGVIMRIAPSASGPLHIGHALVAGLNILYVEKYGGKFYVRIEDTNPDNILLESYKLIEKDAKWLFKDSKIIIQSDRIELYYKYAEKLIKKNSAYVCICSGDKFREFSKKKENCPCRKKNVKENIKEWKKMLNKNGFKSGEAVLRFKSSMKNPNPAMRDFPLARINETKHPRQKNKYRVWPLMNLAVTVDDIELKMTHIIRGKDHRDNAKRQEMIYKVLGKKVPYTTFIGIVHFKDLELSSSKIREEIVKGKYSGWGDKNLPTLISLKKQGYKPAAFLKFSELVSLGENDKIIDKKEYFRLLDNFNK
ncbi:glutamate--tRNA ligase [Candidatus Pacearchaeota archaeon]|jgi:glutamyl-tRNA synthetase|nr:glutamate--tRNA ligase [Candidatus Pacearchaeota archaeon]MAH03791.1 glutamate--tRNA ligase [Candidatus Pacearchaeota archaeon]|tara:strand:+ start:1319 stop:2515 length:1197 start_codon:yes stop_codon:yes gene_type:complete